MKKRENLTNSVAITGTAYETLVRMSQLTGLSLGQLTSNAIERTFDPRKNAALASVLDNTKTKIAEAIT